jgi:hypothetical protein
VPSSENAVGVFNPLTHALSLVDISGIIESTSMYEGCVLAPNGKILQPHPRNPSFETRTSHH